MLTYSYTRMQANYNTTDNSTTFSYFPTRYPFYFPRIQLEQYWMSRKRRAHDYEQIRPPWNRTFEQ